MKIIADEIQRFNTSESVVDRADAIYQEIKKTTSHVSIYPAEDGDILVEWKVKGAHKSLNVAQDGLYEATATLDDTRSYKDFNNHREALDFLR